MHFAVAIQVLYFLSLIILPVQFFVLIAALHEIMFTFKVSSSSVCLE